MVSPNYFTCTLGQAQRINNGNPPYLNVLNLLEEQSKHRPNSLAIGFADYTTHGTGTSLTFKELNTLSFISSSHLPLTRPQDPTGTVALLSTSNIDFILTFLGLLRSGYSVLFLAPQLQPAAIRHLCNTLDVHTIFVGHDHAEKVSAFHNDFMIRHVPTKWDTSSTESVPLPRVAYYCHTSGTSSGLPKPIEQTHAGVVGALPSLGSSLSTFSTTPLYHGGFPDAFRAWTSGAGIWFFPEGVAPITGSNVVKAVEFARKNDPNPVAYFSSVPYVLQGVAEEQEGMQMLQSMDLVGVGGAALPSAAGDTLVGKGVNLISRMGSAECGFLLSSHRQYGLDKEWQYLWNTTPKSLSFESRDDGLFELVVRPEWPFTVKINREDGSYATSDLFEPHPEKSHTWKYHSRTDAQITLANGKKFDPAPMEGSLMAALPKELQDVLIFGAEREYPGILVFPATRDPPERMVEAVWPVLESMNQASQSHARINKSMVIVASNENGPALEKSSKGTILRRQANERYKDLIQGAYAIQKAENTENLSREQLRERVQGCFKTIGRHIDPSKDLYQQGIDSMACIQVRRLIQATCLPEHADPLPTNILYDQSTVDGLVEYLSSGAMLRCQRDTEQHAEMRQMAEEYSQFSAPQAVHRKSGPQTIVLTGSTGFLGAHVLHYALQDPAVRQIICLVRASAATAQVRITQAQEQYCLPSDTSLFDKMVVFALDAASSGLGLAPADVEYIRSSATLFIHSAWAVNFNLSLRPAFDALLSQTRSLLELSMDSGARFVFVSSVASVSAAASRALEKPSSEPGDASTLGYSRSKWVAERVCDTANRAWIQSHSGPFASVVRVGQLCGNDSGVWNASEAYPLMLSTVKVTGCLPDLRETLNWLSVDIAAKAILEIASDAHSGAQTPVYHVMNTHETPIWKDMLHWLSRSRSFQVVTPQEWLATLESFTRQKQHPSQALLGLWESSFKGSESDEPCSFSIKSAQKASPSMAALQPITEEMFLKMWKWIDQQI